MVIVFVVTANVGATLVPSKVKTTVLVPMPYVPKTTSAPIGEVTYAEGAFAAGTKFWNIGEAGGANNGVADMTMLLNVALAVPLPVRNAMVSNVSTVETV